MGSKLSIWDKVNYDIVQERQAGSKPPAGEEDKRQRRRRRIAILLLDLFSAAFWIYAILKLFVIDFDQQLVARFAPGTQWLLDYKFFVVLGFLAILVLTTRKLRWLLATLAYVALFPVIVVCWKVPRAIYRTKSWVAAFAVLNAVTSVLLNARYAIVSSAVVIISGLAAVIGQSDQALTTASIVLGAAIVISLGRTIRFAVVPARFLTSQQRAIQKVVDSDLRKQLTTVNEELRSSEVERFTPSQQQSFVQNLSQAVLVHRFLAFWAYQLEQYRKSPGSIFFSSLSYLGLLVLAVASLALINESIYKMDPTAYSYERAPSAAVFVRYALTSLWGNEIDALKPVSDAAQIVSILAFLVGGVFLATLLITWFMSYRHSRDETAIHEAIDQIHDENRKLDAVLEHEYEVTVGEAFERLRALHSALLGAILFFSTRIPEDFEARKTRAQDAEPR